MDLTNSTLKNPEPETETQTRIQTPNKASPFSNGDGVLKRNATTHLHHPVVVTYKECLKNHAASLGGHAVDGCGEFMPSANTNHADPTSLKCAACGCHRNFHSRDPEEPKFPPPNAVSALEFQPYHRHHPPPPPRVNSSGSSPNNSPSPPPISSAYYPNSAPHMLIALSNTPISTAVNPTAVAPPSNSNSRKRFRTRFNQDQKVKMLQFAERLGWKMQKRDEDVIGKFCSEIGVNKGVFKVWMHNNKSTAGKKDLLNLTNNNTSIIAISSAPPAATSDGAGAHYHHHHHHQETSPNNLRDDNGGHDIGTNRSSSS